MTVALNDVNDNQVHSHTQLKSRYRVPWERKHTVDMDNRRSDEAIMVDFYKTYRVKLTKWAKKLCTLNHVPMYVYEDMVQAAMMQAFKVIPKWNPHLGNMWTYSYLALRKAMLAIAREYHHNKIYSKLPEMKRFIVPIEDIEVHESLLKLDEGDMCIEARIDVCNAIQRQMKSHPTQTPRLLRYALDTNQLTQLAAEESPPISKQGYDASLRRVRERVVREMRDKPFSLKNKHLVNFTGVSHAQGK